MFHSVAFLVIAGATTSDLLFYLHWQTLLNRTVESADLDVLTFTTLVSSFLIRRFSFSVSFNTIDSISILLILPYWKTCEHDKQTAPLANILEDGGGMGHSICVPLIWGKGGAFKKHAACMGERRGQSKSMPLVWGIDKNHSLGMFYDFLIFFYTLFKKEKVGCVMTKCQRQSNNQQQPTIGFSVSYVA